MFFKYLPGRAPFTACLMASALGFFMTGSALADEQPAATVEASPAPSTADDPFEDINRATSSFNRFLREGLFDPLADGYQAVTPDPIEEAVSNVISNLSEPFTIGSSLLQGDTENAGRATSRLLINSTIGMGGIGDPATDLGVTENEEDLGQAAGAHGVPPGPHLVIPILGPSNTRDFSGDVLEALANPLSIPYNAARGSVSYSDNQDTIQGINKSAVDPYVAEREMYEQNRQHKVTNGQSENMMAAPALDDGPSLEDEEQEASRK